MGGGVIRRGRHKLRVEAGHLEGDRSARATKRIAREEHWGARLLEGGKAQITAQGLQGVHPETTLDAMIATLWASIGGRPTHNFFDLFFDELIPRAGSLEEQSSSKGKEQAGRTQKARRNSGLSRPCSTCSCTSAQAWGA